MLYLIRKPLWWCCPIRYISIGVLPVSLESPSRPISGQFVFLDFWWPPRGFTWLNLQTAMHTYHWGYLKPTISLPQQYSTSVTLRNSPIRSPKSTKATFHPDANHPTMIHLGELQGVEDIGWEHEWEVKNRKDERKQATRWLIWKNLEI